jgi:uncharacterized MAPEG superfamily protein
MTVANWCVLAAALIPYVFTGLAKSRADFDNASPRRWLADVGGWRQRAHWAQLNSLEAFPPFAAAVIIAQQAGASQRPVDALAVAFVAVRLIYGGAYILDYPRLRSTVWLLGIATVVGLFVVAAQG